MQTEERAKYTADEIKALGAKGHAFRNPDGHYSYPVDDEEDLDDAIRAVGRGGASHDAIRAYIIGRAKAMGKSSKIPDNWTPGGSSTSADRAAFELRKRRRGSMIGKFERRALPFATGGAELRARPSGHGTTNYEFNGYAVTYEQPFEMWDQWGDRYDENVEQRACSPSLARGDLDTPFLIGHNDGGISLARTKSGTMRLSEDSRGLAVNVPDLDGRSPLVQSLASAIERRDMDEMSVGFICRRQEWSPDFMQRNIQEMDIHRGDVSIVCLAANPATAGATLTVPGLELSAAARRTERRANPVDQDLGDAPDYSPWKNTPGAQVCGSCDRMQSPAANFCDGCGAGGDALIRVNADGVPALEEEQGAAAQLALRQRQLELLALRR